MALERRIQRTQPACDRCCQVRAFASKKCTFQMPLVKGTEDKHGMMGVMLLCKRGGSCSRLIRQQLPPHYRPGRSDASVIADLEIGGNSPPDWIAST